MRLFLLHEGLNASQAELAIDQVLAGNPARAASGATHAQAPAIHVPANATSQASRIEHALAALSAALDPFVLTSLSIERHPSSTALRLVPWGGPEDVKRALGGSSFALPNPPSTSSPSLDVSSAFDNSVHLSKTKPGHVSLAASKEILRLDLHRTAATRMRALNLYPPTTFTLDDEREWSERLLTGGTVLLPIRNPGEQARPFYEQLAEAAVSDAQALRGIIAPHSMEWKGGKTPALLVNTGIA
jgi:hypothetical protein